MRWWQLLLKISTSSPTYDLQCARACFLDHASRFTLHESRSTLYASRYTFYASRVIPIALTLTLKLLAVETSTDACSCALSVDGECRERYELAPRRHGELVLPMMEALLAEAGLGVSRLDALAFGRGPGAFTGVRIAAAVVQGIAFARDLPVAPVSSLRALAQGVHRELAHRKVLGAFDARMKEVYWGTYQLGQLRLMEPLGADVVCEPGSVPIPGNGGWFGAGLGWLAYERVLRDRLGDKVLSVEAIRYPHARDVAVLGESLAQQGKVVPAEQALPKYLREKVV